LFSKYHYPKIRIAPIGFEPVFTGPEPVVLAARLRGYNKH
ncbi:MAG: hypothetical protein CSMARM4_0059, partial [Candidatus Parvarchaeum acidiphilum ARMAN-4_'5-way FS']